MYKGECKRIDSIISINNYINDGYRLIEVEIDETGFCIATFDMESWHNKYEVLGKEINAIKIYNAAQINYYLEEQFLCTVLGIGITKKRTRKGDRNFIYVKFLLDDKFKVPKRKWETNTR